MSKIWDNDSEWHWEKDADSACTEMPTGIQLQGWLLAPIEERILARIRGHIADGYAFGRVRPTQFHCSDSDGFERWNVCSECGGIIVNCFCCGSVDRSLTTCSCHHDRTH